MPTKTSPDKPQTPFLRPTWPWNQPPLCGDPTRQRCQSIVTQEEADAGAKLVREYREQESIALINDIDGRASHFDKPFGPRGVAAELLRREMAACDHDAFLKAQARLAELRVEALKLVTPIAKRLVESLADELNDTALTAEERLDRAGLPLRLSGKTDARSGQPSTLWMLHNDPLVTALWSCRGKAEELLGRLSVENSVGTLQFFTTTESGVPFSW